MIKGLARKIVGGCALAVFVVPIYLLTSLVRQDLSVLFYGRETRGDIVDVGSRLEVIDYAGPSVSGTSALYVPWVRLALVDSDRRQTVFLEGHATGIEPAARQVDVEVALRSQFRVGSPVRVWCVPYIDGLRCVFDRTPRVAIALVTCCYIFFSFWMVRYVYQKFFRWRNSCSRRK